MVGNVNLIFYQTIPQFSVRNDGIGIVQLDDNSTVCALFYLLYPRFIYFLNENMSVHILCDHFHTNRSCGITYLWTNYYA